MLLLFGEVRNHFIAFRPDANFPFQGRTKVPFSLLALGYSSFLESSILSLHDCVAIISYLLQDKLVYWKITAGWAFKKNLWWQVSLATSSFFTCIFCLSTFFATDNIPVRTELSHCTTGNLLKTLDRGQSREICEKQEKYFKGKVVTFTVHSLILNQYPVDLLTFFELY